MTEHPSTEISSKNKARCVRKVTVSATHTTLGCRRRTLLLLYQEEVVAKLLAGESCAGVFPTGAGKSICYQLPGTLMARQGLGLTLVVSPLIALMKDQVR